jgi:hypothetical protein
MIAKNRPQCLPYRLKPVNAVSPVASVYRSISMFRNHWIATPTTAPQRKTRPTCDEMYGQRMNSPEASPTPAPTMPGPTMRQVFVGGSGRSRTCGAGKFLVGRLKRCGVDVVSAMGSSLPVDPRSFGQ